MDGSQAGRASWREPGVKQPSIATGQEPNPSCPESHFTFCKVMSQQLACVFSLSHTRPSEKPKSLFWDVCKALEAAHLLAMTTGKSGETSTASVRAESRRDVQWTTCSPSVLEDKLTDYKRLSGSQPCGFVRTINCPWFLWMNFPMDMGSPGSTLSILSIMLWQNTAVLQGNKLCIALWNADWMHWNLKFCLENLSSSSVSHWLCIEAPR